MSDKIRIFNLTDVETSTLKQYGLVNVTIAVGRALVGPGETVETGGDDLTLGHLHHFITKGALAVGTLPPEYNLAKSKMPKPAPAVVEKPVEKNEPEAPPAPKKGKDKA